jgi:hypothetical protein
MKLLRLIALGCCLLLLLPAPAQAAARQEDFACQIADVPFLKLVTEKVILTRPASVDGIELTLRICAPKSESYSAEKMLDMLAQALPHLNAHAGVPFYGSKDRLVLMVARDQLVSYADGQLTEGNNVIELHSRSQDWTVVHEGAHYWSNSENFAEEWMVEGYAEYMTEQAMGDMHSNQQTPPPAAICDSTPLRSWQNTGLNVCGYTAGAAVFRDLSRAVGEERFKEALRLLATNGGVTSYDLLAALERASGKDLLDQMRPVFEADEFAMFKRQRELQHQLDLLGVRAGRLGIELPAWLESTIQGGELDQPGAWLAALESFLPAAEALAGRCAELKLGCIPVWRELPADLVQLPAPESHLKELGALLDQFAALQLRAQDARLALPAGLSDAVATFDIGASETIRQANVALDAGLALEGRCTDLGVACPETWRARWSAAAFNDAVVGIGDTEAVLANAKGVDKRCEGIVATCHKVWQGALANDQLSEAKRLLAALDEAIGRARDTQRQCGDMGAACRATWAEALGNGGISSADIARDTIASMLLHAHRLEARCSSDWPCRASWQAAYLQANNPQDAIDRMEAIEHNLPQLQAAAGTIAASSSKNAARAGDSPIAAAQHALAEGQIEEAVAIAEKIAAATRRQQQIAGTLPVAGLLGLTAAIALVVFLWRRRAARPAVASNADLLAALLSQPASQAGSKGKRRRVK